uniref:Phosphoinositide-3-kinase, regulatory subunit 6b n=1 Tax=Amphilophus citrinellus TaxID=61819 RepID=A0A3Q0T1Q7_AMPCI
MQPLRCGRCGRRGFESQPVANLPACLPPYLSPISCLPPLMIKAAVGKNKKINNASKLLSVCCAGILAWSLQRKVEDNPSCSVSLIPILQRGLFEAVNSVQTQANRLLYFHIQSGVTLHKSLYQNLYECLVKLLILPSPYSTVALHTLRSIKMEMTAPGSLYLKRVIAEQNMKNEHFAMREKVFVLADPAVFSAPLEATVKAYLNVVLEDHVVKEYFQDVVQAVNQCLNDSPGGRGHYLNQLKQINKSILAASNKGLGVVCDGMCYYEHGYWKRLSTKRGAKLHGSSGDNGQRLYAGKAHQGLLCHTVRVCACVRVCVCVCAHTLLIELSQNVFLCSEKESKHNMLTKKLDLQLYYIPVSGDDSRLSLASCLDRVDPWYSVNISSLGAAIPTLPELVTKLSLYLLDTMCYYLRCGTQPVNLPVYSVKVQQSYHMQVCCVLHVCKCGMQRDVGFSCGSTVLIYNSIYYLCIKTMEHRTLCVCLDKDPSRTYTDIQRIEISPCLDPGCNIRSRRSIGNEQELPFNKYLDKVLSVPINTFSGVTI